MKHSVLGTSWKGWWSAAGKVTVDVTWHRPWVTDWLGIPITKTTEMLNKRWACH